MKKRNIIEFTAPRTQQQTSSHETDTHISEELKIVIQELIPRLYDLYYCNM